MDSPSVITGNIVIIGGGHAAASLCSGLNEAGLGGQVHVICEEQELPYQRPPLSKAFLKLPSEPILFHKKEAWFTEAGITIHSANVATNIDRTTKTVQLQSGESLSYARLIIATGTRARRLPSLPDHLSNVHVLRTAAHAVKVRTALASAQSLTVLGGGFIGLEVAATAKALGKNVTVLEAAPRLLGRAVSPALSTFVQDTHIQSGIDIRLGASVGHFDIADGKLVALTVDGKQEPVELMLLGIGATPEQSLAHAAGLECGNGIVVDELMRTSDENILAVGDCTSFHLHGGAHRIRLESVQNAMDQARTAVATIQGKTEPYKATPWFWSDQGGLRLQMVGLVPTEDATSHRRDGANASSFSVLHYTKERLVCVESVNNPQDHLAARKILEAGKSPAPATACNPEIALRSLI